MNITTIIILSLSIVFGLITTLFISKIILSRIDFKENEKVGMYFKYSSFLIGSTILLKICLENIVYTSDILVSKNFNFKNLEFYKLTLIYFIIYYFLIIIINFISNKLRLIIISNDHENGNLKHIIASILFIAICFLNISLLEMILNYYKPTVETQFYR
ncbi:hypothetical protein [Chishuiella sp.]|uniref:hypothetical protein n=1 Tax=Chishuiella sp. TaxID=1969467 RepID=UPI0028AD5C6F|nr:hypothetical protein [Chishuiella sp.]